MTTSVLASEDSLFLYRHVHYYSTMAEFGLQHWVRPDSLDELQKIEFRGKVIEFKCRRTPNVSLSPTYDSATKVEGQRV
jgi:hypothetical protein